MVFPNIHSPKQLYFYVKKSSTFRLPGFSSGLIYFFIKLLCFHGITSPEEDKTTNGAKNAHGFVFFGLQIIPDYTTTTNPLMWFVCDMLPNFRLEMLNAVHFQCTPWTPCLLIILYPSTQPRWSPCQVPESVECLQKEEIHDYGLWWSGRVLQPGLQTNFFTGNTGAT